MAKYIIEQSVYEMDPKKSTGFYSPITNIETANLGNIVDTFFNISINDKYKECKVQSGECYKITLSKLILQAEREFVEEEKSFSVKIGLGYDKSGILQSIGTFNLCGKSLDDEKQIQTLNEPLSIYFSPVENFTYIYFILVRDKNDFDRNLSRQINSITIKMDRLINKITENEKGSIKRIGVEGRPGCKLFINGSEINIGRRGIFEVIEDINITSLCFAPVSIVQTVIVTKKKEVKV